MESMESNLLDLLALDWRDGTNKGQIHDGTNPGEKLFLKPVCSSSINFRSTVPRFAPAFLALDFIFLKLRYSGKATQKLEIISHFVLRLLINFKIMWKIFFKFCGFLTMYEFYTEFGTKKGWEIRAAISISNLVSILLTTIKAKKCKVTFI